MEALYLFHQRTLRRFARRPFIRLLRNDPFFAATLGVFVLGLIFLALAIPRIWIVSPPSVEPAVQVSGLDLAQAWSLKRSAMEQERKGDLEGATFSWLSACANNRADPDLIRGFLRNFIHARTPRRLKETAIRSCFWLLKLSSTNRSDLHLACDVLESSGEMNLLLRLLEPHQETREPELEAIYLKALFWQSDIAQFELRLDEARDRQAGNEEIQLYEAARFAGWGGPRKAAAGFAKLDEARESTEFSGLACRLTMAASVERMDHGRYRESLEHLETLERDSLLDHIGYWRLLAETGLESESVSLIRHSERRPSDAKETIAFARLLAALNLSDERIALLRESAPQAGSSQAYWTVYADALIASGRWDDLKRLAYQMRQNRSSRNRFTAFSYYLEGRAAQGLQRDKNADAAFDRMVHWPLNNAKLWLAIAGGFYRENAPSLAMKVLSNLRQKLSENINYWELLFKVADKIDDPEQMLIAASHGHRLLPKHSAAMQNYAASLLILGQRPEEAIGLTWLLASRYPDSTSASINHAAALRMNGRAQEAKMLLAKLNTNRLTRAQATLYHLNQFALELELGRQKQARTHARLIDTPLLHAPQREWLAAAINTMLAGPKLKP